MTGGTAREVPSGQIMQDLKAKEFGTYPKGRRKPSEISFVFPIVLVLEWSKRVPAEADREASANV